MTQTIKIAILGSTGMLGSACLLYLSTRPEYDLSVIDRAGIDAVQTSVTELAYFLRGHAYAINCIGIIKPRIDEASVASVEQAIRVNALFPHALARAAERVNCRVLQIATDCVYSGRPGSGQPYTESSPSDALDVYGKTKSLGEVRSPAVRHLRCSIIGPEGAGRPKDSLLEWFLGQPQSAQVKGYTNHLWNGVTTLAFARLCHGVISADLFASLPPVLHVVPYNRLTKHSLLDNIAYFYKRSDIAIEQVVASPAVDRTLATEHAQTNLDLWLAAGYARLPYIQQLVDEMAAAREQVRQ